MLVGLTGREERRDLRRRVQGDRRELRPLTNPAALAVQPAKVELVKVPRDMRSPSSWPQFPSSAPAEVVATVNGVAKDGRLQAGRTAKRIVGGRRAAKK